MEELVDAASRGDSIAWESLVDRFTPLLVSTIARFGLTGPALEDVAQTVWLRLIEHLGDLREPRALPGWIVTTARREALRLCTANSRTWLEDPQGPALTRLPAEDLDLDDDLVRAERRTALLVALGTLSPRQRELLLLLIEDPPVPYEEIFRRTGIPVGSIGPTRARALARLRRATVLTAVLSDAEADRSEGRRPR